MRILSLPWIRGLVESPGFLPTVFALGGVLLAMGVGWVDAREFLESLGEGGWLSFMSVAAGRSVFPTLAGACITVAGVVFSITVVGLSQTSSQFGPRLLGNFLRASGTQIVLGLYLATFLFLIFAMGALADPALSPLAPRLAVLVGLLLATSSFGALIYFFHHLTRFLQVPRILDQVTEDFVAALDRIAVEDDDEDDSDEAAFEGEPFVRAPRSGYLQSVEQSRLARVAEREEVSLRIPVRAGHFVLEGDPLVWVRSPDALTSGARRELAGAFLIAPRRDRAEDPEFALEQLGDMALRALSPGVNDPGTAVQVVDRLAVALAHLASVRLPPVWVRDERKRPLLHVDRLTYRGMVDTAFDGLRHHAKGELSVLFRLLECIATLARRPMPAAMREALRDQARAVAVLADRAAEEEGDRSDLEERERAIRAVFAGGSTPRRHS